jgi:hypothetical protein
MFYFFILPMVALCMGLVATFDDIKTLTKMIILLWLIVVTGARANAQEVNPLVVECGHKCAGQFTVSNTMVEPLAVTVQPFSFSLSPKGETLFHKGLDAGVVVDMREMSTRLGPQSSHTFDYTVRCGQPPCLVALVAGMAMRPNNNGLVVRLVIPHIVYACERSKDCRKSVRAAAGMDSPIESCLKCMGDCHEAEDCKAQCNATVCKVDGYTARLK